MQEKTLLDEKKPVKVGNSFYFSIPRNYITNKIIDPKLKYKLIVISSNHAKTN